MKRVGVERGLLLLVLLATVAVVDPRGEFPLDDDWNFALTTWKFAETGELQYSRFTAMTLKTQVVWGAVWTLLFGKSFLILRVSTLVLWVGVVWLLDGWLRRLDVPPTVRWLAVLALAFHPIVLWSAFTFMTQVPFLFCSIAALAAFHRGLSEENDRMLWIGAVCTVGAYLIRQTGVALAVAPLVVLVRHWGETGPGRFRKAAVVASPIGLFVVLLVFTNFLDGYPGQIREHFTVWNVGAEQLPAQVARVVGYYTLFNLQNGGLFLGSLLIAALTCGFGVRSRASIWVWIIPSVACAIGAAMMILKGFPLPYWSSVPRLDVHPGNIFVNLGLGPLTLRDTWTLGMDGPFALSRSPRIALTYLAALLGAATLSIMIVSWRHARFLDGPRAKAIELAVAHCVVATLVLLPSGIYFDRYCVDSLWSLAILLPAIVSRSEVTGWRVLPAGVVLLVTMIFGVLATQEYLEWNRVRWQAFHDLRSRGVELSQMDGGYEINQYLIGGFDGPILLNKSGFSVIDNEYVITFNRLPGYAPTEAYRFRSFLGFREATIHVLRRVEDPRAD